MAKKTFLVSLYEVYEESFQVVADTEEEAFELARKGVGEQEKTHSYELKEEATIAEVKE